MIGKNMYYYDFIYNILCMDGSAQMNDKDIRLSGNNDK
jgi:hypothetical protein